jgi:hypothetical protein
MMLHSINHRVKQVRGICQEIFGGSSMNSREANLKTRKNG